ncbi:hypothetical protein PanWU01x14_144930, partial [Parasponia andersonii]
YNLGRLGLGLVQSPNGLIKYWPSLYLHRGYVQLPEITINIDDL